jgi:hypothetical protein
LNDVGTLNTFRVIVVENTRKSMLPPYVDRVPLMVMQNKVFKEDDLFDMVYGKAVPPEAGGQMCFGSFSDLGAPLDGSDDCCGDGAAMKNFYDLSRPPPPMDCPPDDVPDNRHFDMDKLQKQRMEEVPQPQQNRC